MVNQYYWALTDDDFIAHHGILGQKWGVRRFQDKNGRLTDEGKRRIQAGDSKVIKDIAKERTTNMYKNMSKADLNKRKETFKEHEEKYQKRMNAPDNTSSEERKKLINDSNKSGQKLAELREDDIKKLFGDLDLSDYDLKRDIDSAFADVSDKYIYTPVRNSIKKENRKEKVQAALSKVSDIGTDIATNVATSAIIKKVFG